jgi:phage shock protein PspC (stress-responsive transcriptional regulator)
MTMDRVVSVNLNGNAYQVEEAAYAALADYLSRAQAALSDNADRNEVIADLEQAIADKCSAVLSPHKSVVTSAEMAQILTQMGPVEGEGAPQPEVAAAPGADGSPRKRLYRLRDGAMFSGVAAGVGAYFSIDPTIVRILFVVATLLSGGWAALVYIVMMFVVPSANTSEEWAAAHGLPATAQEVIEAARRRMDALAKDRRWREWGWPNFTAGSGPKRFTPPPSAPQAGFLVRLVAGLVAIALAVVGAALTLALAFVIASLIFTGSAFGYDPLIGMPIWVTILVVTLVFAALATPIQAMRTAAFETLGGTGPTQARAMDSVVSFGLVAIGAWLLWQGAPEARDLMRDSWAALQAWAAD